MLRPPSDLPSYLDLCACVCVVCGVVWCGCVYTNIQRVNKRSGGGFSDSETERQAHEAQTQTQAQTEVKEWTQPTDLHTLQPLRSDLPAQAKKG